MRTKSLSRFFCFLTAAALLALWSGQGLTTETRKAPRISFEEDTHHFGDVYRGDKVSHSFVFENIGSDDLVIENVKTSCGCTVAAPTRESIPPGTTARIEITLRTGSFRGDISKTITVSSNDSENPSYILTVGAHVKEEVVAEPRNLWLDQIKQGLSVTKDVEIKPVSGLKLKVTKARATSPLLKLHYKKKGEENAYVLSVTTRKDAPLGRFTGDIQVFTNSGKQRLLVIPFFGEIISDVSVFPAKVSYGVVRKGEEAVKQILVTVHKNGIQLKEFELEPDYLSLRVIPTDTKNYLHRLEITLGGDVPPGRFNGSLTIHTTSKDQPVLKIPVYGVVKEG
ncbi:MAG: DUF1573 domain-containing protein [Planctomycetes bacterium]|nr:DUF1573 domain-containing protein [Planctomycetota bacterium]